MKVIIHNADGNAETWRALGIAFKDFAAHTYANGVYSCAVKTGPNIRVYAERNKKSIRLVVQPKEQPQ